MSFSVIIALSKSTSKQVYTNFFSKNYFIYLLLHLLSVVLVLILKHVAADFDKSSTWIRSNCSNNDLNYFRANNGEVNAGGASDLKDEEWDTFNTPCRWGTQGAWLKNQRRQTNSSDVSKDGRLLALLSENGKLEIFKHPCVDKGAQAVVVNAHAVHGTTVRFSADGKYIYTVGGRDRLLMQWRVDQLS